MPNQILFKRGNAANLPTLAPGEPAIALDTGKMYVGATSGNVLVNPDSSDKAATADKLTTARTISLSGDATGNTSFDGSANKTIAVTLANSGVTAGTYPKVTVDAKGRVTNGAALTAADIPALTLDILSDANAVELIANKGEANGYAGLDANKKLLLANMPDAIIGQMIHAGELDVSTMIATLTTNGKNTLNVTSATITLTNDTTAVTGYTSNQGNYYVATKAGTFASYTFAVGDWLVANASGWAKVDNTDAVTSVNGSTGAVSITTITGNAGSATKLQTARNITVNLESTSAASFNGTANVTPGVSGELPIANGGTGASTAAAARTALGAMGATDIIDGGTF